MVDIKAGKDYNMFKAKLNLYNQILSKDINILTSNEAELGILLSKDDQIRKFLSLEPDEFEEETYSVTEFRITEEGV